MVKMAAGWGTKTKTTGPIYSKKGTFLHSFKVFPHVSHVYWGIYILTWNKFSHAVIYEVKPGQKQELQHYYDFLHLIF